MLAKHAVSIGIVVAVAAILLGLFGDVGQRLLFRPDVVYEFDEAETIVGPNLSKAIGELEKRRREQIRAEVEAEHPEWDHDKRWDEGTRRALLPENLFEDQYLRLQVSNRGRGSAEAVRIAVQLPGVVVHQTAECSARPGLKAKLFHDGDGAAPTGLELTENDLPRLVPQESVTIKVWYYATRIAGVAYEPTISVQHSQGAGRDLNAPKGFHFPWGVFLLGLAFAASLWWSIAGYVQTTISERLSRQGDDLTTEDQGSDGEAQTEIDE